MSLAMTAEEIQAARDSISTLIQVLNQVNSTYVRQRVEPFLTCLQRDIEKEANAQESESSNDFWFKINAPNEVQFFIVISRNVTLTQLKECLARRTGIKTEQLHLFSPNINFHVSGETPLSQMMNLEDKCIIDVTRADTTFHEKGTLKNTLQRVAELLPLEKTVFQKLSLTIHSIFIEMGFVCTGLGESSSSGALPGFAAPIRDIPLENFIPDGWDSIPDVVSIRYRHPAKSGKVFILKMLQIQNQCMVNFGEEGHIESTELSNAEYEAALASRTPEKYYDELFKKIKVVLVEKVVPALKKISSRSSTEGELGVVDPLRVGPPTVSGPMPIPGMGPTPGNLTIPGYGGDFAGDLTPGGGVVFPGGGGLMGPDHPIFGGPSGMTLPRKMQLKTSERKRQIEWKPQYSRNLGIRVVERDPATSQVLRCACCFCECFGRELNIETNGEKAAEKMKRRKTKNVKVWNLFRSDNIRNHMVEQHPKKFDEYQKTLSAANQELNEGNLEPCPNVEKLRDFFLRREVYDCVKPTENI